jgi:hypothetical protein
MYLTAEYGGTNGYEALTSLRLPPGRSRLSSATWTPVGGLTTASNRIFTVSDSLDGASQKFYRLQQQLP